MPDPCAQISQSEYCRLKGESCGHRFEDLRSLFLSTSEDQDAALTLAKQEVDRRLLEMNKFRDQLADAEKNFVRTSSYEIQHKNLSDKIEKSQGRIDELLNWKFELAGKSAASNLIAVVSLFVSFVIGVLHFFPNLR